MDLRDSERPSEELPPAPVAVEETIAAAAPPAVALPNRRARILEAALDRDRLWNLAEIAAAAGIYFGALWILGPLWAAGRGSILAYWALVFGCGFYMLRVAPALHGDPPEWRGGPAAWAGGRGPGAFRTAAPAYGALTAALIAVLIAGIAGRRPALLVAVEWNRVAVKFAGYLIFAWIQAAIFFVFLMSRVRSALPRGEGPGAETMHRAGTALATAGLFSLSHLPNGPLMAAAFPAAFGWAWIYYRRPNLPLVALSHAILGTLLSRVALLYTRIGPFYAHPEGHLLQTVLPGLKQLFGGLF